MSKEMTADQFEQIMARLERIDAQMDRLDTRLEHVEDNMVRKSDVFQAVLTVQAFTAAIIVGCIVVLNALGAFG